MKYVLQTINDVTRETKEMLVEAHRANFIDADTLATRLAEADACEQKLLKQTTEQIRKAIEAALPFESMLMDVTASVDVRRGQLLSRAE